MSRDEVKVLLKKIMAAYPNFKPVDVTETVNVWATMLGNVTLEIASKRLDEHISSSPFAPTISDILQRKNKNSFDNFEQRHYDFEALEKEITNNFYY